MERWVGEVMVVRGVEETVVLLHGGGDEEEEDGDSAGDDNDGSGREKAEGGKVDGGRVDESKKWLSREVRKWMEQMGRMRRMKKMYGIDSHVIISILCSNLDSFCFRFSNMQETKEPKYFFTNIWAILKESAITFVYCCHSYEQLLLSSTVNKLQSQLVNNHCNMLLSMLLVLGAPVDVLLDWWVGGKGVWWIGGS